MCLHHSEWCQKALLCSCTQSTFSVGAECAATSPSPWSGGLQHDTSGLLVSYTSKKMIGHIWSLQCCRRVQFKVHALQTFTGGIDFIHDWLNITYVAYTCMCATVGYSYNKQEEGKSWWQPRVLCTEEIDINYQVHAHTTTEVNYTQIHKHWSQL